MAKLSFTRPTPLNSMNSVHVAVNIAAVIGGTVTCDIDPTLVWANGTNVIEANRTTIQNTINAYVFDPAYARAANFIFTLNGANAVTWTNMPAALTEVPGSRLKLPLSAGQARLTCDVRVAGAAGSLLIAQVSLDQAAWVSGPQVIVDTTGLKISNWVAIGAQYQTDVFVRLAGQGGDGVVDPQFGLTTLQVS
jgi:hypothetical protein